MPQSCSSFVVWPCYGLLGHLRYPHPVSLPPSPEVELMAVRLKDLSYADLICVYKLDYYLSNYFKLVNAVPNKEVENRCFIPSGLVLLSNSPSFNLNDGFNRI